MTGLTYECPHCLRLHLSPYAMSRQDVCERCYQQGCVVCFVDGLCDDCRRAQATVNDHEECQCAS